MKKENKNKTEQGRRWKETIKLNRLNITEIRKPAITKPKKETYHEIAGKKETIAKGEG